MKVVIVGGGAGGISTASRIRKMDKDIEITVLTRDNKVAYSPCAIPYVLSGTIETFDDIVMRTPEDYKNKNIDVIIEAEVTAVDSDKKTVTYQKDGKDITIDYDKLVLATGGNPFIPPMQGVDLDGVFKIRNIEDGMRVQEAMKDAKSAIVTGAGLIGIEIAFALKKQGLNVILSEMMPQIVPRSIDKDMSDILVKYLEKAPEFEPAVTSAITKKMTMEELIGDAEIVLDWKDYNISVVAAHEFITEKGIRTEVLRVGCFIDGEPLWGHVETLQTYNDLTMLRAFIGGTEEDPMVMLYDGGYGLTMMDLLSGSEKWTLNTGTVNLGDAAAVAVNDENGIMYIAGTDGPDPVAITQEGRILWQSRPNDPELTEPCEIILKNDRILVRYKCGRADGYQTAMFDLTGEIIRIEGKQE